MLPGCRILVSSARKPISYINLAKRFLSEHGEVQLSALGIAIAPAVTVAEILKSRGLAVDKRIVTALETLADENRYDTRWGSLWDCCSCCLLYMCSLQEGQH